MQEINLLQNRVKDTSHVWERQSKLILTFLSILLIIIIGVTAILFLLNRSLASKTAVVTEDNLSLQKQLLSQQKDVENGKAFQAQLANLRVLLNNHIYISPFLDELSKSTYQRAQYTGLDVTTDGQVHLEGIVSNYIDLGKLLLGLSTSSKFKNVKLLSVQPSSGKDNAYTFALEMSATSDIFTKK